MSNISRLSSPKRAAVIVLATGADGRGATDRSRHVHPYIKEFHDQIARGVSPQNGCLTVWGTKSGDAATTLARVLGIENSEEAPLPSEAECPRAVLVRQVSPHIDEVQAACEQGLPAALPIELPQSIEMSEGAAWSEFPANVVPYTCKETSIEEMCINNNENNSQPPSKNAAREVPVNSSVENYDAHVAVAKEDALIEGIGKTDVYCGRGEIVNRHPGNMLFHQVKKELQPCYLRAIRRKDKTAIAQQLVDTMKLKYGSRFLAYDSGKGKFVEIDKARALEKAKQVLREVFTAEQRRVKREKYFRPKKKMFYAQCLADLKHAKP